MNNDIVKAILMFLLSVWSICLLFTLAENCPEPEYPNTKKECIITYSLIAIDFLSQLGAIILITPYL